MRDAEVLERARRIVPRRYEPKSVLGTGAMGHVVQAWDDELQRDVALKLLVDRGPAATEARKRFMREARALAALDDDRLVRIFDVDAERGLLVLELVDGASLRRVMNESRKIDVARARRIAIDVLDGLAVVHAASLVHRDVKPANILLDKAGRAKLADFGIAYVGDKDLTKTGTAVGTPGYMAPEQIRGRNVDGRADLYALAATMFEAVTGEGLHDQERSTKDVRRMLFEHTKDAAFADAISRAAETRADRRFSSAVELRRALAEPPRRAHITIWVAAAVVVVTVAFGLVLWREPSQPRPQGRSAANSRSSFDQHMAIAVQSLEEHQIGIAVTELELALRTDPNAPDPHYYLALARWWMVSPKADIERHIARALEVGQVEKRRTFLNGLRILIEPDYGRAVEYFDKASQLYPDDRAIAYGLFEAYFHGGLPRDAVRVYEDIVARQPKFTLGMMHAFSYAVVSRDERLAEWVFDRVEVEKDSALRLWEPRWMLANGRHADALATLDTLEAVLPASVLRHARIEALTLAGRPQAAIEMFDPADHPIERLLRSSLMLATGARETADEERRAAISAGQAEPRVPATFDFWLSVVQLDAARGDRARLEESRDILKDLLTEERANDPRFAMVDVLASAVLEDEGRLRSHAGRKHPEVANSARAAIAEHEGRAAEAAELWLLAAHHSNDGRFLLAAHHHAARAFRAAGLDAEARAACREVTNPRLLSIDWGALVQDCATR